MLEVDGIESTPEDPRLIQEQLFVISPDLQHEHHFTYHAEWFLQEYLKSISYPFRTVHEYTDGRHCFGSLSSAADNFGCDIIRHFYETSHAKGAQDAAGGFLKQQAGMAVLRGKRSFKARTTFIPT